MRRALVLGLLLPWLAAGCGGPCPDDRCSLRSSLPPDPATELEPAPEPTVAASADDVEAATVPTVSAAAVMMRPAAAQPETASSGATATCITSERESTAALRVEYCRGSSGLWMRQQTPTGPPTDVTGAAAQD
jgi:hypothetical protein